MAKEKEQLLGITVKKEQDFSEWYNQVVLKAELADYAPIRGFMVIKPRGYGVWEKIQAYFNSVLEKMSIKNAYFPLLIPESFFRKEAEHAKGFAPELAWVEKQEEEERVAIRPTSETIIYDFFAKWLRSHKQLPLRVNQWCNVLRWEVKQTKLFLRTREFLWQEGHCVYATKEDCDKEVLRVLMEYKKLCEELLAIPVLAGKKTDAEKFAGALYTLTVEALMPDGKALQLGTSHNLGQGFAHSFGLSFTDANEEKQVPWQSSWGFSTRLIGAIVMVHADNKGLVLPPNVAKEKIVIVPIVFEKGKEKIMKKCVETEKKLGKFGVFVDDRDDYSAGWKFNDWEMKGVPLRIEIGPKDLEKKQVVVVRRDTGKKETIKEKDLLKKIPKILEEIQKGLLKKAEKFLGENIAEAKSKQEFQKAIENKKMVFGFFCHSRECEETIKKETTATSRCIPIAQKKENGKCMYCGRNAGEKAYFAKSY